MRCIVCGGVRKRGTVPGLCRGCARSYDLALAKDSTTHGLLFWAGDRARAAGRRVGWRRALLTFQRRVGRKLPVRDLLELMLKERR